MNAHHRRAQTRSKSTCEWAMGTPVEARQRKSIACAQKCIGSDCNWPIVHLMHSPVRHFSLVVSTEWTLWLIQWQEMYNNNRVFSIWPIINLFIVSYRNSVCSWRHYLPTARSHWHQRALAPHGGCLRFILHFIELQFATRCTTMHNIRPCPSPLCTTIRPDPLQNVTR